MSGATREGKRWAAERIHKPAAGAERRTLVGEACFECYKVWQDGFQIKYGSFDAMCDACDGDPELTSLIDRTIAVQSKGADRNFHVESRQQDESISLVVERAFLVLSESELRGELAVPRLLKGITRGLYTIQVPSESDPSQTESAFVFQDPARPYRTARLAVGVSCIASRNDLPREKNIFQGQARDGMTAAWNDQAVGSTVLLAATLPTLQSFLSDKRKSGNTAQAGNPKATHGLAQAGAERDAQGDDESDGDDDAGTIVGIAASSPGKVQSKKPLSGTPPGQRRPPVPTFQRSSSAGSLSAASPADDASPSVGASRGTAASAAGGSAGEDGDEDDDAMMAAVHSDDEEGPIRTVFGSPYTMSRMNPYPSPETEK